MLSKKKGKSSGSIDCIGKIAASAVRLHLSIERFSTCALPAQSTFASIYIKTHRVRARIHCLCQSTCAFYQDRIDLIYVCFFSKECQFCRFYSIRVILWLHGTLKLDMSTLFTTFFLWTSLLILWLYGILKLDMSTLFTTFFF